MNPMNRRMFRDPMMARRAAGILASSPELMAAAQRRMPVKMQAGGSVSGNYVRAVQTAIQTGDTKALQEFAKPVNYGVAARTNDGKAAIALATQALGSLKKAQARVETVEAPEAQQPLSDIMAGIMSQADASIAAEAAKFPGQTGFDKDMERTKAPPQPNPSFKGPLSNNPSFLPTTGFDIDMENTSSDTSNDGSFLSGIANALRRRSSVNARRGKTELGRDPDPVEQNVGTDLQKIVSAQTGENINVQTSPSGAQFAGGASVPDYGSGIPPGTATNTLTTDADLVEAPRGAGENLAQTTVKPEIKITDDIGASPQDKLEDGKKDSSNVNRTASQQVDDLIAEYKADEGTVTGATSSESANNAISSALQAQNSDLNDKQKAEATDEAFGITGNRRDRVKARQALLKELIGEDESKDIRGDVGYNVMIAGLIAAAGDDPNAIKNLANGIRGGLENFANVRGKRSEAKRKEDRAIALKAIDEVGAEISEEQKRAYDAQVRADSRRHDRDLQEQKDIAALKRLKRQLTSAEQRQIAEFDFKRELNTRTFEQNIAQLRLNDENKRAILELDREFKLDLQDLQNQEDSAIIKTAKALQAANPEVYPTLGDAYAATQAKSLKTTDQQNRYNQLVANGMRPAQALIFSQAGVVTEMFKELGSEEAETVILEKMNPSTVNPQPGDDVMAEAASQGLTWDPDATAAGGGKGAFVKKSS